MPERALCDHPDLITIAVGPRAGAGISTAVCHGVYIRTEAKSKEEMAKIGNLTRIHPVQHQPSQNSSPVCHVFRMDQEGSDTPFHFRQSLLCQGWTESSVNPPLVSGLIPRLASGAGTWLPGHSTGCEYRSRSLPGRGTAIPTGVPAPGSRLGGAPGLASGAPDAAGQQADQHSLAHELPKAERNRSAVLGICELSAPQQEGKRRGWMEAAERGSPARGQAHVGEEAGEPGAGQISQHQLVARSGMERRPQD